ncbi:MAG TPA: chemotaxis-specific protein-glutamate methyltransferase CheB [Gaiellaceae bacterium]|jgi:two-component system chemotaxis response regulator CheB|nr:chemotaxis-specific protein-glutamate methyltransferase CheB [Gaiellaceae bacterium]
MIKVLIAEDSPSIAAIMRDLLKRDPEIDIVGWAKSGREAVSMRNTLEPDVITMDLNMPLMGGLEAIRTISTTRPVPILVVSSLIENRDSELAFEALRCGALDIMGKPSGVGPGAFTRIGEELKFRIKAVSRIHPMRRYSRSPVPDAAKRNPHTPRKLRQPLVVIGASTGGPPALAKILGDLPRYLPVPIAVVQHIATGFVAGLRQWLERQSTLPVHVASDEVPLQSGHVYLAPDDRHLEVASGRILTLNSGAPRGGHRPSVDRLMESAAHVYGPDVLGVLLTGMGRDGAAGLKSIRDAGGRTIVQDEATSLVFGMPREAILNDAAEIVSPLDKIAGEIVEAVQPTVEA